MYRVGITACATVIPMLLILITVVVVRAAWPALRDSGVDLLIGTTWDVVHGQYGALPAIAGTVLSSLLAIVIATPLALGAAIFTAEVAPAALRAPVAFIIDLLASIPSVVFGLWGVVVLLPLLRSFVFAPLNTMGVLQGPAFGPSLLAAALILAMMIVPFIASVAREVLTTVPRAQRDAALALGATPWEVIRDGVLPSARSGLVGAIVLGFGRALGESIAVALVIGNTHAIPTSLQDPGYTLAALLINEFGEASSDAHLAALMAIAGLLLLVSLIVNVLARGLVARARSTSMA